MNIYQLIDTCNIYRERLTPDIMNEVSSQITDQELIKATNYVLRNLEKKHNIEGKSIGKLWDVCQFYYETEQLTHKQKWLLVHSLIDYWDQTTLESRACLVI